MRIPFNELEEKYFNIIVLYRGISEQEFAQEEISGKELKSQLTPRQKSVLTKYRNKLKERITKKEKQDIYKKISALLPESPDPIELSQMITYTIFALFVNGKIIKNPIESDLISFNYATDRESGGYFNESNLKNVQSYEDDVKRKATNEEVQTGIYQLNQAEYKKLIDLETERARAIQSLNADISTDDFLISLKEIKKEFNNWFIFFENMLSEYSIIKEFKNVPNLKTENINDKIIDHKTEQTKTNTTENNQKPKEKTKPVERIFWLKSREALVLFLQELKDIQFILGDDDIDDIIRNHFSIKGENISETNPPVVKKIRWKPALYEIKRLFELCMGSEYGFIRTDTAIDVLLFNHFTNKHSNIKSKKAFNSAKSGRSKKGARDDQGNQKYKTPVNITTLKNILDEVNKLSPNNMKTIDDKKQNTIP